MSTKSKPNLLMILDGYGYNENKYGNAILHSCKKNLDELFLKYPHTTLKASGLDVGLPRGQMGNSEVGHLNIGAGRIVYQELTKISKEIEDGIFFNNISFANAIDYAAKNDSALHLMGLLSDGGVHSHIDHLLALMDLAKNHGLTKVYIHAILDGRDVPPQNAITYLKQVEEHIKKIGIGEIVSVSGRYYAMDRDNRWDRVEKYYDAITLGQGEIADSIDTCIRMSYDRGNHDEFVLPTLIQNTKGEINTINDNDAIIMFNFRPDRAREITRSLVDGNFDGFTRKKEIQNLVFVCMTQYHAEMPNVLVAFPPQSLANTLGEYLSEQGLQQLRIAETEKYAHVTFFFNGGIETPYNGEYRILIPSPKVATYDLQPEMSAFEVTRRVVEEIEKDIYDVIILNFANPDMVGHSGNMEATIKAIEALDQCVPQVIEAVLAKGGQVMITADHGNADVMMDAEGNPITAHSTNPVPFLVIAQEPIALRTDGILADIAPTLLDLMHLEKPAEMTGKSLLIR